MILPFGMKENIVMGGSGDALGDVTAATERKYRKLIGSRVEVRTILMLF